MHRLPAAIPPLGLVVLAACPVEQTYADLIKEHGKWVDAPVPVAA